MALALAVAVGAMAFLTGCGGDFDPTSNIAVFHRELGSGTREVIVERITGTQEAITTNASAAIAQGTEEVNTNVSGNRHAISYESVAIIGDSVRALSFNGVAPTQQNVINGTYALSRDFVLIARHDAPFATTGGVQGAFYSFINSSNARELTNNLGPVYNTERNAATTTFVPTVIGTQQLRITGSTSMTQIGTWLASAFAAAMNTLDGNSITYYVAATGSGAGRTIGFYRTLASDAPAVDFHFGMASASLGANFLNTEHADFIPNHITFALDAVAIIVHPSNPLTNITTEQARRIFVGYRGDNDVTGSATNAHVRAWRWEELFPALVA